MDEKQILTENCLGSLFETNLKAAGKHASFSILNTENKRMDLEELCKKISNEFSITPVELLWGNISIESVKVLENGKFSLEYHLPFEGDERLVLNHVGAKLGTGFPIAHLSQPISPDHHLVRLSHPSIRLIVQGDEEENGATLSSNAETKFEEIHNLIKRNNSAVATHNNTDLPHQVKKMIDRANTALKRKQEAEREIGTFGQNKLG
jgi:hypothetical protein